MIFSDNRIFETSGRRLTALLAVFVLVAVATGPAAARLVKEPARQADSGPDAVFAAIAAAWENEDEEALAALVHGDGLRVTSGEYERFTNYSPSQAFYYFKNQFQLHPTLSFRFERQQEQMSGQDRVHGMVVWECGRHHAKTPQEIRLVLVLVQQDGRWRLAEINTITTR